MRAFILKIKWSAAMFIAVCVLPAQAVAMDVVVVIKDNSPVVYRLETALHHRLRDVKGGNKVDLSIRTLDQFMADKSDRSMDLIVPVGTEATLKVAESQPESPVFAVLIPKLSFEKIKQRHAKVRLSALYLDQPFSRRLALVKLILPQAREVAAVLGPSTASYEKPLQSAAKKQNLRLRSRVVSSGDNPVAALESVLEGSDAMLAVIDPLVFNRKNVQSVLLTAYRYRVPLIGVSPAYIKAGALAAVYATPEQLGRQLAEILSGAAAGGGRLPPKPQFPAYFSVSINRSVARSLGLSIAGEERLQDQLQKGSKP